MHIDGTGKQLDKIFLMSSVSLVLSRLGKVLVSSMFSILDPTLHHHFFDNLNALVAL